MVKGCLWGIAFLILLIVGIAAYFLNNPNVQRNSLAYESWPILFAAEEAVKVNGTHPKSLHDALEIYRKKDSGQAALAENYIKRYEPIVMVQWTKTKTGVDLWIRPTQNCAPGWISVRDGVNNISSNQHPPSDAVYMWIPGSPKP